MKERKSASRRRPTLLPLLPGPETWSPRATAGESDVTVRFLWPGTVSSIGDVVQHWSSFNILSLFLSLIIYLFITLPPNQTVTHKSRLLFHPIGSRDSIELRTLPEAKFLAKIFTPWPRRRRRPFRLFPVAICWLCWPNRTANSTNKSYWNSSLKVSLNCFCPTILIHFWDMYKDKIDCHGHYVGRSIFGCGGGGMYVDEKSVIVVHTTRKRDFCNCAVVCQSFWGVVFGPILFRLSLSRLTP